MAGTSPRGIRVDGPSTMKQTRSAVSRVIVVYAALLAGGAGYLHLQAARLPAFARLRSSSYGAATARQASGPPSIESPRAMLDKYCVTCHNTKLKTAGLTLDALDVDHVGNNAEIWEKVATKLRTHEMPPATFSQISALLPTWSTSSAS